MFHVRLAVAMTPPSVTQVLEGRSTVGNLGPHRCDENDVCIANVSRSLFNWFSAS